MNKDAPYLIEEAERLYAYHGAPATKCPLDDNRFLATVYALEDSRNRVANAESARDNTLNTLRAARLRLQTLGESVPEFVYQELMSLLDDEMLDDAGNRIRTQRETP